jgi:hypothetical protein
MFDSLSIFAASMLCLLACVSLAAILGYLIDRVRSVCASPGPKVHIHRAIRDRNDVI